MAESLLRLEEYQEAMLKVKGALIACYHINSMQNVTMIADLYRRMSDASSYTFVEAKEVGDMLTTWYGEEQKRDLLS